VLIIQLVRLVKGGEVVRMSKRRGVFFTLEELLDEVGVDPTRYFLLERAPETPLDFDVDLAQLSSAENPVYYIQYAGARIHSILRQARAMLATAASEPVRLELLSAPEERELFFLLARFPEVVERAALERAPHHLPRYLIELARAYHGYYRQYRVLEEQAAMRQARLALSQAVLAVITRGLQLLGISQPERM
jgi:arginyl-tRNA synthetase